MIDFHCHLDLYDDPVSTVQRCIKDGMYVLSVTTTPSAWSETSRITNGVKRIRVALGLHPHLASERKSELVLFDELISKTRYIGEVGLDGSPELRDQWIDQVEVFERVLASCSAHTGKIVSIHSRRAVQDVLGMLEKFPNAGTFILHWYSGTYRDLRHAIDLGCWFSVGPAMTRTAKGKAAVARMPKERVLTETDGPFAVVDGRRLNPWDVELAIRDLSNIWHHAFDDTRHQIYDNLQRLVGTG